MVIVRRALPVLLSGILLIGFAGVASPAEAETATGQIYGRVVDSKTSHGISRIQVRLFDRDWKYLGAKTASAHGVFSFGNRPYGSYRLQFADTRPTYDVSSHVTKDATVSLKATSVKKIVAMTRGGSITGTIKAHSHAASGAKLIAVGTYGSTHETTANSKGQFAIGGLASDSYTVFSYDAKEAWTTRSKRVANLKVRTSRSISIAMNTRAGRYSGFLTAGGVKVEETVYVTAVNRSTGQYWVRKIVGGDLAYLGGLAPGSYDITVPSAGGHLGRKVLRTASIVGGRTRALNIDLPHRGGTFTGTVVDAETDKPLKGITILVYDKYGQRQEPGHTAADGTFDVGGTIPDDKGVTVVVQPENTIAGITYMRAEMRDQTVVRGANHAFGTIKLARVPAPPANP